MFFNSIVNRSRTIGSFSDTGIFISFELTNDDVTVFIDVKKFTFIRTRKQKITNVNDKRRRTPRKAPMI